MVGVLHKTVRAAFELLCHLILCVVSVAAIFGFEWFVHWLWGTTDPLLFDRVPLRWLFQAVDVALIVAFGIAGIFESWTILRGHRHD